MSSLLAFQETNPVLTLQKLSDYGLLKVIHPGIVFDEDLEGALTSMSETLAWDDLLFLDERMRWQYETPPDQKKEVVADGRQVWIYLPQDAVVMITDMKSFSKMPEEEGSVVTAKAIQRHRDLLIPVIDSNHGCGKSTGGDGLVASFTTPDDALLAAAERGDLHDAARLRTQTERMLASPRLVTGARAFFSDMLGFEKFEVLSKDPLLYPKFNREIVHDSQEQMLRTLAYLLLERNADYRSLFTSRETFLTRPLGMVYQLASVGPGER